MNAVSCLILLLLCSSLFVDAAKLTYPLKVAYLDQIDCCAPQNTILDAVNAGFNVIVLAFYQSSTGPADGALSWSERMDNATRIATMEKVHAAGAVLTVSLGGANDQRWESTDAKQLASTIANWAKEFDLDGVDFDLEHFGGFGAINNNDNATVAWFSELITTTRSILGPEGVISYAPLPPWFGPIGMPKCTADNQKNCTWVGPSGGMTAVYKEVGDDIDYFFAQFYNQGSCYTTETGLFTESGPSCTTSGAYYPYTSVKEIADGGVPLNKIVVGKPVDARSAGSGYVDPATLHTWFQSSGKAIGWNSGAGIWEWLDVTGSEAIPWLNAVYPPSQ